MSCAFGFDVGSKRVGVAVGSRLTASARGLAVVAMREGQPDWSELDRLQREWLPDSMVIGLPLTLDGAEQPASQRARRVSRWLHERYQVPVALVDERHSSREAAARFAQARAAGTRKRKHGALVDADAAAVILERWLTQPAHSSAPPTQTAKPSS